MELVLKQRTEKIIGAAIDVHQEPGPGLHPWVVKLWLPSVISVPPW
ncbi:MAG TPA: hypothetical protein VJ063_17930 [Verrucomicrobiae bacterium]|nr:hypothetical protein [Verrucomicrobiae bacterium]